MSPRLPEPEERICVDCSKPFRTAWAQRLCARCKYNRVTRDICAQCGQKTGRPGRKICGDCRYGDAPPIHPMTTVELAWLAAIIEGEGTFGRHGHPAGQIRVLMTDEDIINRVHILTGVGSVHYRGKRSDRCRPQWEWSVIRRDNVVALDRMLAPLLLSRRRETVRTKL